MLSTQGALDSLTRYSATRMQATAFSASVATLRLQDPVAPPLADRPKPASDDRASAIEQCRLPLLFSATADPSFGDSPNGDWPRYRADEG